MQETLIPPCTVVLTKQTPVHGRQLQLTGPVPQLLVTQSRKRAPPARSRHTVPAGQVFNPWQETSRQGPVWTCQVPALHVALVRPAAEQTS